MNTEKPIFSQKITQHHRQRNDFNSERVFLSGIENVVEIADFCKKQIQKNRKSSKK